MSKSVQFICKEAVHSPQHQFHVFSRKLVKFTVGGVIADISPPLQ